MSQPKPSRHAPKKRGSFATALEISPQFDRSNEAAPDVYSGDPPVPLDIKPQELDDKQRLDLLVWYRDKIALSHQRTYRQIIETGRLCFQAGKQLGWKTEFEERLISSLPFGKSVYSMYSTIGSHADDLLKLEDRLPAHYSTLYLITRADNRYVKELLKENRITPASSREQVRAELSRMKLIHTGREQLAKYEEDRRIRKAASEEKRPNLVQDKVYAVLTYRDTAPHERDMVAIEGVLKRIAENYSLGLSVWTGSGPAITVAVLHKEPNLIKDTYKELVSENNREARTESKEMKVS